MKNYTSCIDKPIDKDTLDKLLEAIKPKKAVVTSDERVYEVLLKEKPFGYEIWLNKAVNGTFVIDLEEMEKAMKPPFQAFRD